VHEFCCGPTQSVALIEVEAPTLKLRELVGKDFCTADRPFQESPQNANGYSSTTEPFARIVQIREKSPNELLSALEISTVVVVEFTLTIRAQY
jgi:hypothetical protein